MSTLNSSLQPAQRGRPTPAAVLCNQPQLIVALMACSYAATRVVIYVQVVQCADIFPGYRERSCFLATKRCMFDLSALNYVASHKI